MRGCQNVKILKCQRVVKTGHFCNIWSGLLLTFDIVNVVTKLSLSNNSYNNAALLNKHFFSSYRLIAFCYNALLSDFEVYLHPRTFLVH